MFISILQNAALIAFTGLGAFAIFSNAALAHNTLYRQIMIGFMMGVMVFLTSTDPFILDGIQGSFDVRIGTLVFAGYLGGPLGGLIAAACGAVARLNVVGPDLWTGTAVSAAFGLFGAGVAKAFPTPEWPQVPRKAAALLILGAMILQVVTAPFLTWGGAADTNISYITAGVALMMVAALSTTLTGLAIHCAQAIASTLRESAETTLRLKLATSAANLGIFGRTVKSDYVSFDQGICDIFGIQRNERKMTLRKWLTFIFKEDIPVVLTAFAEVWQGTPPNEPTVFRIVRADGTIRHVQAHWATLPNDGRPVEKVVGIYEDVTFSVEAQLNKVLAETRLNSAVRIAGIGLYTFNSEAGNCTFCSDQHAAHLGMTPEEFQNKAIGPDPYLDRIHQSDHQTVLNAINLIRLGQSQTYEYRAFHPNGDIRYIRQIEEPIHDENGKVIEHIGTSLDLTDLRQAEMRLRQSQRIEAMGTLTGGISHDFNNLLSIILGNLELWLENGSEDQGKSKISTAYRAAQRGADLTKSLLSFSRRAPLQPVRLNLNKLLESTLDWTGRILPATVTIEECLFTGLWDIEADAVSAENAIINLILNARDAMPDGGTVRIETANLRIATQDVAYQNTDIPPGRYVLLTISDTGRGIAPSKIEQVFEPFYTSKPRGKGSGLGLSMVQGFVEQSGGTIRLSSEVGVGTTFKLYFKANAKRPVTPEKPPLKNCAAPAAQTKILVVEDDPEVLRVIAMFLEGAGYSVVTAKNGEEALATFKLSFRTDLLLTDSVMPGSLQGPSLIREIRLIRPDLPCIILSGYVSDQAIPDTGSNAPVTRLAKPVNRSDLLHAVSNALETINRTDRAFI
ncbi:MAG: PAS domain-containing protein [Sulfitobacter sp.]